MPKLLVVEDNPLISSAIERAGEGLKMQIDVASDGWDAIELLRDGSYGAIVIDADLPRHSGYGVLSYLREEKGDHLRNVILMTSSDTDTVRQLVSDNLHILPKSEALARIADMVSECCDEPE